MHLKAPLPGTVCKSKFFPAFFILLFLSPLTGFTQIIWNIYSDSLSITPRQFESPGVVKFKDGNTAKGIITIDLNEKEIYFNDSINSLRSHGLL